MRWAVAQNPVTPEGVLRALAKDEDFNVREGAASNPSMPPDALTAMVADDEDEDVVAAALVNIGARISEALGVDVANAGAIGFLREQAWWDMKPGDAAVTLAVTLSPDA